MNEYGALVKWYLQSRSTRRKPCSSINLSTTNLAWIGQGLNSGFIGERPATKRPSPSTACGLRNTSENLSRYNGSSIRETKPRPHKYNADMLAPTPRSWLPTLWSIRCEIKCDRVLHAACIATLSGAGISRSAGTFSLDILYRIIYGVSDFYKCVTLD
jgi:hypothetical protein